MDRGLMGVGMKKIKSISLVNLHQKIVEVVYNNLKNFRKFW